MMHANKQEKTIHLMHTTTNWKHTFYGKKCSSMDNNNNNFTDDADNDDKIEKL